MKNPWPWILKNWFLVSGPAANSLNDMEQLTDLWVINPANLKLRSFFWTKVFPPGHIFGFYWPLILYPTLDEPSVSQTAFPGAFLISEMLTWQQHSDEIFRNLPAFSLLRELRYFELSDECIFLYDTEGCRKKLKKSEPQN